LRRADELAKRLISRLTASQHIHDNGSQGVSHKWAGTTEQRFAPDHEPVIGSGPAGGELIWLAGKAENGVMGCGRFRLAASFGDWQPSAFPNIASPAVTRAEMCLLGRACVAAEVATGNRRAISSDSTGTRQLRWFCDGRCW